MLATWNSRETGVELCHRKKGQQCSGRGRGPTGRLHRVTSTISLRLSKMIVDKNTFFHGSAETYKIQLLGKAMTQPDDGDVQIRVFSCDVSLMTSSTQLPSRGV